MEMVEGCRGVCEACNVERTISAFNKKIMGTYLTEHGGCIHLFVVPELTGA